jgi:hypothetical protein
MNFNKKRYFLYKSPHDSGFNKLAYYTDIKINRLGFRDSAMEFPFKKKKDGMRSLTKMLKRLGVL